MFLSINDDNISFLTEKITQLEPHKGFWSKFQIKELMFVRFSAIFFYLKLSIKFKILSFSK